MTMRLLSLYLKDPFETRIAVFSGLEKSLGKPQDQNLPHHRTRDARLSKRTPKCRLRSICCFLFFAFDASKQLCRLSKKRKRKQRSPHNKNENKYTTAIWYDSQSDKSHSIKDDANGTWVLALEPRIPRSLLFVIVAPQKQKCPSILNPKTKAALLLLWST